MLLARKSADVAVATLGSIVMVWLYRSWYFSTAGKGSRYLLPQELGLAQRVPPNRDPLEREDLLLELREVRVDRERERPRLGAAPPDD